ncbi:MAG: hypothetical protein AAF449_05685, partial [Myxococcota bacterium]
EEAPVSGNSSAPTSVPTKPIASDDPIERTTPAPIAEVAPSTGEPAAPTGRLPPLPERLVAPTVQEAEPVAKPSAARVRLGLGLGSGLFRDYAVNSPAGDASVSYQLPPILLVGITAEFDIGAAFGLALRGMVRSAAFDVAADQDTAEPSGLLVDGRLMFDYRLSLGSIGQLQPQLGLRFARTRISNDSTGILVSAVSLAPTIGARAVFGGDTGWQFSTGVDVGYIALYEESPEQTGDSGRGFALGVDLGTRYWFDHRWAISVDARFTLDQIGFSGDPTRVLQADEIGRFRDASLSVIDATVQFGVVLGL